MDELERASKELTVLRKAQLIMHSSGVAPYEDRKAISEKVMETLRRIELLAEADSGE